MRQLAEENLDEDVRNGELDAELSRIEANIKIFTEIERRIKMDCLRKRMRKQKMVRSLVKEDWYCTVQLWYEFDT